MSETKLEVVQSDVVENVDKPSGFYTFRPLEATDTFLMCKIIKAIGLKEFKACFDDGGIQKMIAQMMTENKESGDQNKDSVLVNAGISVFVEIADVIIGNLPKCENEIFQLLSNVSNLTEKQVRKMGFADFFGMVIDFIKKEEFKDFFKVVSKLF